MDYEKRELKIELLRHKYETVLLLEMLNELGYCHGSKAFHELREQAMERRRKRTEGDYLNFLKLAWVNESYRRPE